MIQTQTILKVASNSGAKTVKCIKFGKSNNGHYDFASIGDCILVSVRSLRSGSGSSDGSKKRGSFETLDLAFKRDKFTKLL